MTFENGTYYRIESLQIVSVLNLVNTINGNDNAFFRTAIQTITVRPITASKTTTIIRCALIENVIAKNSTEETSVDHCPYVSGIGIPVPAIVAALVFIGFV